MRTWLVGHREVSSATAWLDGWLAALPHHRAKVVQPPARGAYRTR